MKNLEGSICLIPLPQADGKHKIRPVLLLKQFSPFNDYLVCGISTQIHQFVDGFDELLRERTIATGENILLVAFGAGLTWGSILLSHTSKGESKS
jgi:hypothetical protein